MFKPEDLAPTADSRRLPGVERNLSVMPSDLRQANFGTAMRGFNRAEVTAFIAEAADAFERTLRENERLRQEMARLETALAQYRDIEGSLKSTLMSAQKVADDMRENAAQESARIVREAEGRAEMVTLKAQARLDDAERAIDGLKQKRREAETSIETTISTLKSTLDLVRDHERRERDERVVLLRGRADISRPA